MTKPKLLRLAPVDIPVEVGILYGTISNETDPLYRFALDASGTLYLTFQRHGKRPRLSIYDPAWNANHGLRYVEWVSEP